MSERASLIVGREVTKNVRLLQPLGAGGMGAVWLAEHLGLKTRVVVKFMLGGLDSSPNAKARFEREAEAAAKVKSPHVVQMLDHGVADDGTPFIVMEHLEGHDLGKELSERGAMSPQDVVLIITQVAKALSKVHAAGLLHRDIKPDNIFLVTGEDERFAKLLDFGIAKSHNPEEDDSSLDGQTKTGQVVGTPFYMSPEQVTAQKVIDARSDLWALGVVAFEALTGRRPFDGPSFGALAVKIATGTPPKPTEVSPSLPPSVDAWFAKACARDPAVRFKSAKELAEGLRAAFEGVVSLPPSMSDSGSRGLSGSSGSRDASGSGPRSLDSGSGPRSNTPNSRETRTPEGGAAAQPGQTQSFGLASTIHGPDASAETALGKSEPGSPAVVVEEPTAPPQRGVKRVIFISVAVIAVAGGLGVFMSMRTPDRPNGTGPSTSAPTQKAASATSAGDKPPASVSTVGIAAPPPPSSPVVLDAPDAGHAATAASSGRVPSHPIIHGTAPIKPPASGSADPPPKPSAKPGSSIDLW